LYIFSFCFSNFFVKVSIFPHIFINSPLLVSPQGEKPTSPFEGGLRGMTELSSSVEGGGPY
ncbi:MAG: hypothetical protein ACO28O_07345, partial [Crocinitomicaceae bacterium]